jgi:hypothetical protein
VIPARCGRPTKTTGKPCTQYRSPHGVACLQHMTDAERAESAAATEAASAWLDTLDFSVPACHQWPVTPGMNWLTFHNGRCAACGRRNERVEDHCHMTGLARGWLCQSCNVAEGAGLRSWVLAYRVRPPAVILEHAEPYAFGDIAEPEPIVVAVLGPRPDDPAEAAAYLARAARIDWRGYIRAVDKWKDNAMRNVGL